MKKKNMLHYFILIEKNESFKIFVDLDDFYKLKELNSSWFIVKKKK